MTIAPADGILAPPAPAIVPRSPIPGAKILLQGGSGSGKTFSIKTFVQAGITPFVIFTEPGMDTLEITCPQYHYRYIAPALSEWNALAAMAENVNKFTYEAIIKMTDTNKSKYIQFIEVIKTNNDFVCDRCGIHFGDVQKWGTDKALVVDSLTGLNTMVKKLHIGGRPVMQQSEWQVTQNTLMPLLDAWCAGGTRCWFVLIAHQSQERDEATGAVKRMVNTLGKAIAPDVPKFFSDVIETIRIGDKFSWDTAGVNVEVKARNVAIRSGMEPSFVPLVEGWKKKGGIVEPKS